MRDCSRCPHRKLQVPGANWEDLPCAHCTSDYAQARTRNRQSKQIIREAHIDAPAPDDYIARRTVLAWTHVSRTYPAACAYILAKIADQSLSYADIAKKFSVSKSTVQYQIGLAVMAEPDLAGLLSVDHTRNKRKAHKRK